MEAAPRAACTPHLLSNLQSFPEATDSRRQILLRGDVERFNALDHTLPIGFFKGVGHQKPHSRSALRYFFRNGCSVVAANPLPGIRKPRPRGSSFLRTRTPEPLMRQLPIHAGENHVAFLAIPRPLKPYAAGKRPRPLQARKRSPGIALARFVPRLFQRNERRLNAAIDKA